MKVEEVKTYYQETKDSILKPITHTYATVYELGFLPVLKHIIGKNSDEFREQLHARNMEMVLTVHRQILSGKKPFAIAGAAHYIGEMGMQVLMKQMGYKIRRVICEEPRK